MKKILYLTICLFLLLSLLFLQSCGNTTPTVPEDAQSCGNTVLTVPEDVNYVSIMCFRYSDRTVFGGYILSAIPLNDNFYALQIKDSLSSIEFHIAHKDHVQFLKKGENKRGENRLTAEEIIDKILKSEFSELDELYIEGDFLVYRKKRSDVVVKTQSSIFLSNDNYFLHS